MAASPESVGGLFITLYDEDTLSLYLAKGIYSFLMPPQFYKPSSASRHYAALADYGCVRDGTHLFFFLKRRIVYGGQAIGVEKEVGAFYINGEYSPLGREAGTPLFWDESSRYEPTSRKGIFKVNDAERCQPFVILFRDRIGLKGKQISSDDLYFELGKYPFPLPSNSIQDMGFCTLTPGETKISLQLMEKSTTNVAFDDTRWENIPIKGHPTHFSSSLGIKNVAEAYGKGQLVNESHLEFSVLSNPTLLPESIIPKPSDIMCRQVPISPFKPFQMDRADICYYDMDQSIFDGALPNRIVELKAQKAGLAHLEQVNRYLRWLHKIAGDRAASICAYVYAPKFSSTSIKKFRGEFAKQITLVDFSGHVSILD